MLNEYSGRGEAVTFRKESVGRNKVEWYGYDYPVNRSLNRERG